MFNSFWKCWKKESLLLPLYIYAIINLHYSRPKSDFLNKLLVPLKIATTILLTIISIVLLTVFAIWNEITHWILQTKYKRKYFGLLDGMSAMLACTKRPIIQIAIALEADKSPAEMLSYLQQKGALMKEAHPVLNSVVDCKFGYYFYRWIDVNISEIIKPIGGYGTSEEFNLVLDEIASSAMPLEDTLLWEIYIGDTPINWPNEKQKLHIPVVLRFNHLLGDGLSIMSLCTAYFADQGLNAVKERFTMFNTAVQNIKDSKKKKNSLVQLAQRKVILNNITNPETQHILHMKQTGNRKMCIFSLDTDGSYFSKIRSIKSRIPNLKFNDVVFTALCASLSEYVGKKGQITQIPKEINIIVPYTLPPNINDVLNLQDPKTPKIYLRNSFTAAHYKFPLIATNSNEILLNLLNDISKQNTTVLDSHDLPLLHYLMGTVFSVLPVSIVNWINKSNDGTLVFSNMPGFKCHHTTYNGCKEVDLFSWTMNLQNTGLTFLLSTHNQRLRLTLQQDCNFIQTREEGQSILDGVFHFIQQLDDATMCLA